mgnify:CR=1 FL=1
MTPRETRRAPRGYSPRERTSNLALARGTPTEATAHTHAMQDEREPVRLPLDTRAVQNWLSAHGQAFKDVRVLAQFGAGQSNPTYLLQARCPVVVGRD